MQLERRGWDIHAVKIPGASGRERDAWDVRVGWAEGGRLGAGRTAGATRALGDLRYEGRYVGI